MANQLTIEAVAHAIVDDLMEAKLICICFENEVCRDNGLDTENGYCMSCGMPTADTAQKTARRVVCATIRKRFQESPERAVY